MVIVPYFLAFMAASTAMDYGPSPDPRVRYERAQYRTLSDCLIALERLDYFYRSGASWLVEARCTTLNPYNHR
jgi:hypothetical protein